MSDFPPGDDILLMMSGDHELLAQYTRTRSDDAFAALVRRHLPLVYSAALRQVRSAHLAEDVAQAVFTDLALSAHKLRPDTVLSAWLYTVTGRTAVDFIRRESRRQQREQTSSELLAMNATEDWADVEPSLDDAMRDLEESDRTAILLRYFENKPLREVGAVLGISEDAAQKRVTRAIDRLRTCLSRRTVAVSATVLATGISAHAVTAAPAALAATIASAAAGAISTATLATAATKGIAMTALQKSIVGIAAAVAAGVGIYQANRIGDLRDRMAASEQREQAITATLEQVTRDRDDAAQQLVGLQSDNARLTQLLARTSAVTPARTAGTAIPAAIPAPAPSPVNNALAAALANIPVTAAQGRALGEAVVRGDAGALDQLRVLSRVTQQSFNTNSVTLNDQQRQQLHRETFASMREAFAVIEQAAVDGNANALRAIADSAALPELKSRAVPALGTLAAKGNEAALNLLLNGENHGLLRSSIVSALRPAADTGNQRAIDALASVARDPASGGLWYMAAEGLSAAAESGNSVAVDALVHLASSATNQNVYKAVVSGLQRAAYKGNPAATETLRVMGLR